MPKLGAPPAHTAAHPLCRARRPSRYLEHMSGGLAVWGKAHAMPSTCMQGPTQAVTEATLLLSQVRPAPSGNLHPALVPKSLQPGHSSMRPPLAQLPQYGHSTPLTHWPCASLSTARPCAGAPCFSLSAYALW